MTASPVRTRREGAILEVTLDRPKANAIDLVTSPDYINVHILAYIQVGRCCFERNCLLCFGASVHNTVGPKRA